MSHLVRTQAPATPQSDSPVWTVRLDDGSTAGPATLDTLRRWVAEGRLTATARLSDDGEGWYPASLMTELEMDWMVLAGPDEMHGPYTLEALEALREAGAVPEEAQVFKRQNSPAAGSRGLQLVQRTAAAEKQRRDAEADAKRLRADIEAKDLEFEAERQQFAAENSRLKAELVRRDADIASLRATAEQLEAALADRQALEARVVDSEREAERLNEEREALTKALGEVRKDAERSRAEVEQTRAEALEKTREMAERQRRWAAACIERNGRLRELAGMLQALVADTSDPPAAEAPAGPVGRDGREAAATADPSAAKAGAERPRRVVSGQPASTAAPPAPESRREVIEPIVETALAEPRNASKPPTRIPPRVGGQQLANLEAQAQQELARLQGAKPDSTFWPRRKSRS